MDWYGLHTGKLLRRFEDLNYSEELFETIRGDKHRIAGESGDKFFSPNNSLGFRSNYSEGRFRLATRSSRAFSFLIVRLLSLTKSDL